MILFVNNISYCQEALKDQIFEFSDFSGGLVTKLSNQSLTKNQAVICENIRLNSSLKALVKRKQIYLYGTTSPSEAITSAHRLYLSDGTKTLIVTHGDQIDTGNDSTGVFTKRLDLTSGDYRWQWETWHNLALGTDGYNQPVKMNSTDATYLGSCFAKDNGAGAGPNGTYTYKISFYTASYEVIFNQVSNSVTVSDNDIDLSMIPIGPDTYSGEAITGRKVYRNTVADQNTWKLLTNGTIANNTATTLTDSDADGALGAAYPAGSATWTPPKGKLNLISKNRLWIANNPDNPSRLYYSEDGSHDLFPPANYFDIRPNDGDEITFILNLLGKMVVGKTNTIQKMNLDGDDPANDWGYSDPFSFVGCNAYYSDINTPLGIFYFNKDGFYNFNGQYSILLSDAITPTIKDISPSNFVNIWGEFNDNLCYWAYTSKSGGGSVNDKILIYDIISKSFTIDTLNLNCFSVFSGGTDGGVPYAGSSQDGKFYSFKTTSNEIIHKIHADFSGTFDEARYIPVAAGGDATNPIIEIAWDLVIDNLLGVIDDLDYALIDRSHLTGHYTSPVLSNPSTASYDKLYWNETTPSHTNATFAIRSGNSPATCQSAAWSAEFSDPSGSDISGVSSSHYTQYRIRLTTDSLAVTPNIIKSGNYVVKLTYKTTGTATETTIPLHWQSGYLDFGYPAYIKRLTKLECYHTGTNGTLTLKFTNEYGDTDTFNINLNTNPTYYSEYFTNNAFLGRIINLDITNSDLNDLEVKRIIITYSLEPLI